MERGGQPPRRGRLTVLEARAREWPQEWLQQGRAEGQLALLSRLTSHRFGMATAEALVAELTGSDPVRLDAVADLILDCETGTELLDRISKWNEVA